LKPPPARRFGLAVGLRPFVRTQLRLTQGNTTMSALALDSTTILIAVGVLLGVVLLYSSIVYVPNNRIGILERLWAAKGSVKRGLVALDRFVGPVGKAKRLVGRAMQHRRQRVGDR